MRLIASFVMLLSAVWLFLQVREDGVKQHSMFCGMAADYIRYDEKAGPIFEKALAGWKKFQIEDGCPIKQSHEDLIPTH